ncbi:hypothetical protein Acsp02_84490 [Actinoplanes sp. NBRC 103695]|nr:hypothetical protein Acsp02_84490 [Actinoplanes sp. NBRC 103695]
MIELDALFATGLMGPLHSFNHKSTGSDRFGRAGQLSAAVITHVTAPEIFRTARAIA